MLLKHSIFSCPFWVNRKCSEFFVLFFFFGDKKKTWLTFSLATHAFSGFRQLLNASSDFWCGNFLKWEKKIVHCFIKLQHRHRQHQRCRRRHRHEFNLINSLSLSVLSARANINIFIISVTWTNSYCLLLL